MSATMTTIMAWDRNEANSPNSKSMMSMSSSKLVYFSTEVDSIIKEKVVQG
ncbi:hypothetical protein D3C86_2012180 [compost metagenome]